MNNSIKVDRKEPVPAEVYEYVAQVCEDVEKAYRVCTASKGKRKGKIKTNKPEDGTYAYIWRMCRFHCGDDVTMPMTADFDLSDGIEAAIGYRVTFYLQDDTRREILNMLDKLVDNVLDRAGLSKYAATLRWKAANLF